LGIRGERWLVFAVLVAAVAAAGLTGPMRAAAGVVASSVPVSLSSTGAQGSGSSCCGVVSGDGSLVAFNSVATNLVAHDTNGVQDVFVRDVAGAKTRRISVSSDGAQANGPSRIDDISSDGRYIVFRSAATNLVPRDTNHHVDVFVRDLTAATTRRVTNTRKGVQGKIDAGRASISANGDFVIFRESYGSSCGSYGVYVKDRLSGTLSLISRKSNGAPMCLLHTPCGRAGRVSGGRISDDGQIATFQRHDEASDCTAAPGVFLRDRTTGRTHTFDSFSREQDLSPSGRYVVFASGVVGEGQDLFLRDRVTKTTTQLTGSDTQPPSGVSSHARISDDGAFVAFQSTASDLVFGDTNKRTDVFLLDVLGATTTRLSVTPGGNQLGRMSTRPSISADGRFVAFDSSAGNIVISDANQHRDVFLRGPLR
jgi:Tol biopolymer transport system component